MGAGIGPASPGDRDLSLGNPSDGRLDRRLHGGLVRLTLPAGVGGAVVLDRELPSHHRDGITGYRNNGVAEAVCSGSMKALTPSKMASAMRVRKASPCINRSSVGLEIKAISARMLGMTVLRST